MSILEQALKMVDQENNRLRNDSEYLKKNLPHLNTTEPVCKYCDECQSISSNGIEFAGKYFCDENCKTNYYLEIKELRDHDMYDDMRDRGLESFY